MTFDIVLDQMWDLYLKQNKKCAISGIDINFVENYSKNYKLQTASLDRIDSGKEHTIDNVQWVHKRINWMKNNMSMEEFISWCELVVNKDLTNNKNISNEIPNWYWKEMQKKANYRKLPFSITREEALDIYINQKWKCAITGIPINFNTCNDRKLQTASPDRIDNDKGYTADNIQWVHKKINIMRSNMTVDEFVNWCKLIVECNKKLAA